MTCKDRIAIVTGPAGNRMGRSIALILPRERTGVVVNYLTSRKCAQSVVKHIESQGGKAISFQSDITVQDQCKALVDSAISQFVRLDICVIGPSAGWHPEVVDKLDSAAALEDVHKELAPIYPLILLILPGMYERKWGRLNTLALVSPYNSPA